MHGLRFLLALASTSVVGCASGSVATQHSPELGMVGLSGSDHSSAASEWVVFDPTTATAPVDQGAWGGEQQQQPAHGDRHVTLLAGARWLEDGNGITDEGWPESLDEQFVFGLELDESSSSGHGYEVGLLYADDDDEFSGLEAETTVYELYGGYRHTFRQSGQGLHPFVSAGLTVMHGEVDFSAIGLSASEDDTTFGAYARAGLLWDLSARMRLGLDYRHVFAQDFEAGGGDLDADYDQMLLSLGWAF